MKKQLLLLLICLLPVCKIVKSQNTFPPNGSAGVGTALPDGSALFEIKSTNKGMLIPRMTKTQRDGILSPATGLLIYQTNNSPAFYYYDGSGWKKITSGAANTKLSNLAAATAINSSLLPDTNDTKDFGSAALSWKNIYADGKYFLDDVPFISSINDNVMMGQNSGDNIITGDANTAVGNKTMYNLSIGSNNTAVGHRALFTGGTGSNNIAMGSFSLYNNSASFNHAFGYEALYENTTGEMNIAMGYKSLAHNTTGNANIAIGNYALHDNPFSNGNVAIGDSVLYHCTGISEKNTAIGTHALLSNAWGTNNTATGYASLYKNISGGNNTVNGIYSMYNNTGGFANTAIGAYSLYSNTSGNRNTAIGCKSLYSNTSGDFNIAIGDSALFTNATGMQNVAVGTNSLHNITNVDANTAIGYNVLLKNISGFQNTGIGAIALFNTTSGYYNTATGYQSLYFNSTGHSNTASGVASLYYNSTGSYNVAFGNGALSSNIAGNNNTALGNGAGSYNDANSQCVFLGLDADQSVTTDFTNSMAAGYTSRITASNQIRLGNTAVSSIGGYANWSSLSDGNFKKNIKENVPGIEFINKLRPITYAVDVTKLNKFIYRNDTVHFDETSLKYKESETQTGFIAQEVEQAAKSLDYNFSGVDKPKNADDLYGLRYAEFVVPLVKSVQELSAQNEELKKENNEVRSQLNAMQQCLQMLCEAQSQKLKVTQNKNGVQLTVMPNPAHDIAVITIHRENSNTQNLIIKINDMNGKTINQFPVQDYGVSDFELNTSTFAKGIYMVELFTESELIQKQKLIVQ